MSHNEEWIGKFLVQKYSTKDHTRQIIKLRKRKILREQVGLKFGATEDLIVIDSEQESETVNKNYVLLKKSEEEKDSEFED